MDLLFLILAAALLDLVLGDPPYRTHPVRLLGEAMSLLEKQFFKRGWVSRSSGVGYWLLVVGAALLVWGLIHGLLDGIHPVLAWCWDLYIAYSFLCLRDLYDHGQRVLRALPNLVEARQHLGRLVGRDTQDLTQPGVVRATIESLAENLTDGVMTPFWALCLLGLPGLVLVKTISTLDSMVGYRTPRYRAFGWASARADDLIHWLPARLSPLVIALAARLLRLDPGSALRSAWRDHGKLDSPNSGWSEAAYAGALRVRLLGPIYKGGRLVNKDFLGDEDWAGNLDGEDLARALRLTLFSGLIAMGAGLLLVLL